MQNVRSALGAASARVPAVRGTPKPAPASDGGPIDRARLEREVYMVGALLALIAGGVDVEGPEG